MRRVRAAVPAMPIGAITYPPVALDLNTKVWPTFPVGAGRAALGRDAADGVLALRDARLPSAPPGTPRATCVALRFLTGRPNLVVHIVGLVPASPAEVAAFAHEAGASGAGGLSLYPAQSVTSGAVAAARERGRDAARPS